KFSREIIPVYDQLPREVMKRSTTHMDTVKQKLTDLLAMLDDPDASARSIYRKWISLRSDLSKLKPSMSDEEKKTIEEADKASTDFITSSMKYQQALQEAQAARRTLDSKKLLDMRVDDVEDKYAELLEGTRSHIANIDAYIKAIATAFDDD